MSMSTLLSLMLDLMMDIHKANYNNIPACVTNLDTRISHTITQLGHVVCVQQHNYKLGNVIYYDTHMPYTLIFALSLHNNISCLYLTQIKLITPCTFNNILVHSQPATGYSHVYLYFVLWPASYLCYKRCVLEYQQKSGYVAAMVVQLVFTMLKALVFQYNTLSHQRPAKKTRPVKAASHNLHYDVINFV